MRSKSIKSAKREAKRRLAKADKVLIENAQLTARNQILEEITHLTGTHRQRLTKEFLAALAVISKYAYAKSVSDADFRQYIQNALTAGIFS